MIVATALRKSRNEKSSKDKRWNFGYLFVCLPVGTIFLLKIYSSKKSIGNYLAQHTNDQS